MEPALRVETPSRKCGNLRDRAGQHGALVFLAAVRVEPCVAGPRGRLSGNPGSLSRALATADEPTLILRGGLPQWQNAPALPACGIGSLVQLPGGFRVHADSLPALPATAATTH